MKNKCPQCHFGRSWQLQDGRKKCRKCGKVFTPKKSIWDHYRISNKEKKKLVEYFSLGVPVYRARFRLSCSLKTAEKFYRGIRIVLTMQEQAQEPLQGALEMDEALFGGKNKGGKRGWGAQRKILVFGIIKRNGKVRLSIVPNRRRHTLLQEIIKHTKPGSLYYTDDYKAYASLPLRGDHVVVHKVKGKPKGRNHVNGIEGFWSYAKNWLYQYRGVHKKFFHLYLGEISFRFNHREEDILPYITRLLQETDYEKVREFGTE